MPPGVGVYVVASFGLLTELGVDAAEQIHDPDVFDQWSQVWSAMTNAPFPNTGKATYSHVTPGDIAALKVGSDTTGDRGDRGAGEANARGCSSTRIICRLGTGHSAIEVARALKPLAIAFSRPKR